MCESCGCGDDDQRVRFEDDRALQARERSIEAAEES